jgi:hypothetical protein
VVLLRKRFPQNHNLQTAAVLSVRKKSMDLNIVERNEELFCLALCKPDCGELEGLLSEDIIFTNALGEVYGKRELLSNYLKVRELSVLESKINLKGNFAIVSCIFSMRNNFSFRRKFRSTHVWHEENGAIKLVLLNMTSAK